MRLLASRRQSAADEWCIAAPASVTPKVLSDLQLALAAKNQRLVSGKCAASLPAVDCGLGPLSQRGAELCRLVPRSVGGLEASGSALQD